jgi:opacity protein-like surface antigen
MGKRKNILNLTVAILLFMAAPAAADSVDGDRFSLSLGVFITDRDTEAELDGSIDDGTNTDFEKDLGLDSSDTVFRVDGYFRFNERHRVDFSVFDLSRSASKQIERDIQWGDTLYTIDTAIKTDVDLAIYKAAYTYSFLNREDGYLGATAGFYVADSKASLKEQTLGSAEVGELTAPLPVIGLRGEYAFSDRWSFRASGEFFFVEYENIDGSLVDLYAGIDYRVLDNMSVGLGFNSVTIDVDASKSNFDGGLDWKYAGGLLFLKFNF